MHTPTRRKAVTSALALGAVAAAALLAGCDSAPSVIKIGVAQPMSGNLAALGQDMHNGVKLAVDELNKAGFKIKGKAGDDRESWPWTTAPTPPPARKWPSS
jgi:branched-chain amino acid transport system substrate-binding protein